MGLTTWVSVVCLSLVGTICTVGVFYQGYKESLFERIGASLLAVWCFERVRFKVAISGETEPIHLILHVGMAIFLLGLACRVWRAAAVQKRDTLEFLKKRMIHIS